MFRFDPTDTFDCGRRMDHRHGRIVPLSIDPDSMLYCRPAVLCTCLGLGITSRAGCKI